MLRARSAGSDALFDERYNAPVAVRSAVWGRRSGSARTWPTTTSSRWTRAERTCSGPSASGGNRPVDLWVKLCGNSHTGSFKDLGMTVLVSIVREMMQRGAAIRAVACASTGDTSASLAAYAAAGGIPAIVILPRGKVSTAQLVQPLANGATVLALDTDFDGCMAIVKRLATEEGIYLANSMNSVRLEGQKTVGIEIVQQFDWEVPDFVIIPGGNLGNVSALGAGFDMMEALGVTVRRPRIVVAQAAAANPLYPPYRNDWAFERYAATPDPASAIQIGNPVSIDRPSHLAALRRHSWNRRRKPSWPTPPRARPDRMYNCPHTGVALAVLVKLRSQGEIASTDRVVVISTANGLKFTDFKLGYHQSTIADLRPQLPNAPVLLPNDYDAVRGAVAAVTGD